MHVMEEGDSVAVTVFLQELCRKFTLEVQLSLQMCC